jgi:Leucine-rich repeat (LRR) protein
LFLQVFNKLQVLNLSNSKYLIKSPNFLQVPHLEILILKGCSSLVEVHESIGYMERLVSLNLEGCENLRNLPRSISNLKSLETLNLSGCLKIDELPEELGNMTALSELIADKTSIKQLPFSFGLLKNLKTVSLSGCKGKSSKSWLSCFSSWISPKSSNAITLLPASFSSLCYLKSLNLSDYNLCEGGIHIDLGSLSSLQELNLSRNNFHNLPHGIGRLPKLKALILDRCTNLQSISKLPTSLEWLEWLNADHCTSMERLSIPSNISTRTFYLGNCHRLVEIQGLESLQSSPTFFMEGCNNLANDSMKNLLQVLSLLLLEEWSNNLIHTFLSVYTLGIVSSFSSLITL